MAKARVLTRSELAEHLGVDKQMVTNELNQEKARLLGDGPILSFALASSVNMNGLVTDPLTEEF